MLDLNKFRRIYIRHADKEYANGDADMYKHDPGVTPGGIEKTRMVTKHLVAQWGEPERIIVSPYRRTRETAKIMNLSLRERVPMHIDVELSEYLGHHRHAPIDVTESTLIHIPPHPETFDDMKARARRHHEKITRHTRKRKSGVIWIVTHGLIMQQVASFVGIRMAKRFPPLTCLSIQDGDKITKGEVVMFVENEEIDSDIEFDSDSNSDSDNY